MRQKRKILCCISFYMSYLIIPIAASLAGTIYVDTSAQGANNGLTWANAYLYLQDALDDAGTGAEIWVAQGTYKPDQGGGQTHGDREATFWLTYPVRIYGGFPSGGSTWQQRAPNLYETILSGDLNDDDSGIFSPDEMLSFSCDGPSAIDPTRYDNSYHVVVCTEVEASTVLDGFIISSGNTSYYGGRLNSGGGICNVGSRPTLTNCTFIDNWAEYYGGGMYNFGRSSPILINCTFINNWAFYGGGGIFTECDLTITKCTFKNNKALCYGGGGICGTESLIISNSNFIGNSANVGGGGLAIYGEGNLTLTNSTLTGNYSGHAGGAISNSAASCVIKNCVIWSNHWRS